jgi:hypothetical protein
VQDREERGERDEERCWKSGGGRVRLIPGEGPGWQMRAAPTPMPDAVGGEGGHGAAKPDGVIHRNIINPKSDAT